MSNDHLFLFVCVIRRFIRGLRCTSAVGVICVFGLGVTPLSTSFADDLEPRSSIGDWVIFCVKGQSTVRDCSLVTAVEAETDSSIWLKLGFAFSSPYEIAMTIRTPRLNYFKKGISISRDGRQIGRAFIDTCNEMSCQTTVSIEPAMLETLETSKKLTFEYQVAEADSVALSVNFDQFKLALTKLSNVTGLTPIAAVAPTSGNDQHYQSNEREWINATFRVEIRQPAAATDSWGKPVRDCLGSQPTKEVKVSYDLKIENLRSFEEWLSNSLRHCGSTSVYWVINDPPTDKIALPYFRYKMLKDKVYRTVVEKVPDTRVVTTDLSGQVPVRPFYYLFK